MVETHRIRRRKRAKTEEEKPEKAVTIEAKSAHNNIIPNEIMHDILLRLPAKSLLRFKAVCKSWRALLSDPRFKKSHVKIANKRYDVVSYCQFSERPKHYLPKHLFPSRTASLTFINRDALGKTETAKIRNPFKCRRVNILGSCDGLLLIAIGNSSRTLLWNPITLECNMLPTNICCDVDWIDITMGDGYYISGLGYDSSIDEYKGVLFVGADDDIMDHSNMYLCSSSSNGGGWKEVDGAHDGFPYDIPYRDGLDASGITLNGAPHWVVMAKEKHSTAVYRTTRTIIYFDMVEEKFKRLPTPTFLSNARSTDIVTVAVLGGCLCTSLYNRGTNHYDVWVMKEYGVMESHTKLFAIRMPYVGRLMPLGFTKNGDEVVLHVVNVKGRLLAYDVNTREAKYISSNTKKSGGVLLVESLISPGSNEEKKHTATVKPVIVRRRKIK